MDAPDQRDVGAFEPEESRFARGESLVETQLPLPPVAGLSARAGPRWSLASLSAIAALTRRALAVLEQGVSIPYFRTLERFGLGTASIAGQEFVNFASYNYLGLSGHPEVSRAAKEAIDTYGTSVSSSRIASGQVPLHTELERKIADLLGTEDSIAFIGGYITNETTIGHLFGPRDLICYDALMHRSAVEGTRLSGAKRLTFPHNDFERLEEILRGHRDSYRGCLIVIEGLYSMDGDLPDLRRAIELKDRYACALLVDEAHSLGVLGRRGFGVREHFDLDCADVDLWMGTLSKTLASCGGYIAGKADIINYLRFTCPGFVFSVGATPQNVAAASAAIDVMRREPERVEALRRNGALFLSLAKAAGLNTGLSEGHAIVPVVLGDGIKTLKLADALFKRGINVQPILDPVVPRGQSRLRFFITASHSEGQIRAAVAATAQELAKL